MHVGESNPQSEKPCRSDSLVDSCLLATCQERHRYLQVTLSMSDKLSFKSNLKFAYHLTIILNI